MRYLLLCSKSLRDDIWFEEKCENNADFYIFYCFFFNLGLIAYTTKDSRLGGASKAMILFLVLQILISM